MLLDRELYRGDNIGFFPDCVGYEMKQCWEKGRQIDSIALQHGLFCHRKEEANKRWGSLRRGFLRQ